MFSCQLYSVLRYTIIAIKDGSCIYHRPNFFTALVSDSIWSWVRTIVMADGMTGEIGTGVGRVDFSNCEENDGKKEIKTGGPSDTAVSSSHPIIHLIGGYKIHFAAMGKYMHLWEKHK